MNNESSNSTLSLRVVANVLAVATTITNIIKVTRLETDDYDGIFIFYVKYYVRKWFVKACRKLRILAQQRNMHHSLKFRQYYTAKVILFEIENFLLENTEHPEELPLFLENAPKFYFTTSGVLDHVKTVKRMEFSEDNLEKKFIMACKYSLFSIAESLRGQVDTSKEDVTGNPFVNLTISLLDMDAIISKEEYLDAMKKGLLEWVRWIWLISNNRKNHWCLRKFVRWVKGRVLTSRHADILMFCMDRLSDSKKRSFLKIHGGTILIQLLFFEKWRSKAFELTTIMIEMRWLRTKTFMKIWRGIVDGVQEDYPLYYINQSIFTLYWEEAHPFLRMERQDEIVIELMKMIESWYTVQEMENLVKILTKIVYEKAPMVRDGDKYTQKLTSFGLLPT